jgi:hypothetical protein
MCCLAEKALPQKSRETYSGGFFQSHKPKKIQEKAEGYFTNASRPHGKFKFSNYLATENKQVALISVSGVADITGEFRLLANEWYEETGPESSLTRITANPNYLRIIALGRRAIPLILRELQKQPAPWFVALRALTGEENVGKQHAGNFAKIAREWTQWGKTNGYL